MSEIEIALISIIISYVIYTLLHLICVSFWVLPYFTSGFIFYQKTIKITNKRSRRKQEISINPDKLSDRFSIFSGPKLIFYEKEPNLILFRERLFVLVFFNYFTVLVGSIITDNEKDEIKVIGRIAWSNFLLIILLIIMGFIFVGPPIIVFIFLFITVILISFFIQRALYNRFASYLKRIYS